MLADEEAEVQEPILPIVQICDGLEQHRGLAPTLKELHGVLKLGRRSARCVGCVLPPRVCCGRLWTRHSNGEILKNQKN